MKKVTGLFNGLGNGSGFSAEPVEPLSRPLDERRRGNYYLLRSSSGG